MVRDLIRIAAYPQEWETVKMAVESHVQTMRKELEAHRDKGGMVVDVIEEGIDTGLRFLDHLKAERDRHNRIASGLDVYP